MCSSHSAYVFGQSETSTFSESLRPIDSLLESLSVRYHLKLSPAAANGWPGRELRRRRGLKTYRIRISLEPVYVDTGVVRWEVHDVWMYDLGELVQKVLSFRKLLSGLDSATLKSATVSSVIEEAVRQNLADI